MIILIMWIWDISANIKGGVSSTCFEEIIVTNLPQLQMQGNNYIIPVNTAFQLTGTGSDLIQQQTGDV
jgi:hypothetical protein